MPSEALGEPALRRVTLLSDDVPLGKEGVRRDELPIPYTDSHAVLFCVVAE